MVQPFSGMANVLDFIPQQQKDKKRGPNPRKENKLGTGRHRQVELCECITSLLYRLRNRTSGATGRPCLKRSKNKQTDKQTNKKQTTPPKKIHENTTSVPECTGKGRTPKIAKTMLSFVYRPILPDNPG